MPTTETPFLQFWRALDAELGKLRERPATQGESWAWFLHNSGPHTAAHSEWLRRARGGTLPNRSSTYDAHLYSWGLYAPPSHTRNSGKDF